MRIDDELKILAVKTDMTITEMGRRMDKSPQAFSQKIKRGTFTLDDLQEIAMATGSTFECAFVQKSCAGNCEYRKYRRCYGERDRS